MHENCRRFSADVLEKIPHVQYNSLIYEEERHELKANVQLIFLVQKMDGKLIYFDN